MSDGVFRFAIITPKPEHFSDARAAITEIIPETLDEPGCREFVLHEGDEDGRLYLYECFSDEAAFEAHHAKPYTKAVFQSYERWLAEPVEIIRMRRL